MDYKDYYRILGLDRGASTDEIKKAYRKLARKYHPDVSKEADASQRMAEVNEANAVLSDPENARPTMHWPMVRAGEPQVREAFSRHPAGRTRTSTFAAGVARHPKGMRISATSSRRCSAMRPGLGRQTPAAKAASRPTCAARTSMPASSWT